MNRDILCEETHRGKKEDPDGLNHQSGYVNRPEEGP